jgi:hypothetical protein
MPPEAPVPEKKPRKWIVIALVVAITLRLLLMVFKGGI